MRLLIDENISPKTAYFLEERGHDVKLVRDENLGTEDAEIADMAREENRAILTQDTDFGEIYYFSRPEDLTIIVVKPPRQTVESINDLLEKHLGTIEDKGSGLYILAESGYRTLK